MIRHRGPYPAGGLAAAGPAGHRIQGRTALTLACMLTASCDAVDVSSATTTPIRIQVDATPSGFVPDTVLALPLDTLVFRFGAAAHTVRWVRQDGKTLPLDIPVPVSNGSVLRPLANSIGVFHYECTLHPLERGVVVILHVRPDARAGRE